MNCSHVTSLQNLSINLRVNVHHLIFHTKLLIIKKFALLHKNISKVIEVFLISIFYNDAPLYL